MPFKKFDEYMNAKGKVVEKPVVDPSADYNGPQDKAPEKEGDWVIKNGKTPKIPGVGQKKQGDYASSTKPWRQKDVPNGGIVEKGIKPSKHPANTMPKEAPAKELFKEPKDAYPKGSSKKPWTMKSKETKTEEFVNKTSNMSLSEFTKYMLECQCEDEKEDGDDETPKITSYKAGKIEPHPQEAIRYVVHLASKNDRILDSLIHEIKRAGIMQDMIGTSMEHPEGIDAIVGVLDDDEKGPKHARSMVRSMDDKFNKFMDTQNSMYESVSAPYGGYEENEPENDSESGPSLNGQGMGPDIEDETKDDEIPDSDTEHDEKPEEGPPSQDSDIDDKPDEEPKPKKLKKKFPHDHLISAMSDVEHMRDKMKSY